MAWTRKSIVPHCFFSSANTASTEAMSSTSHGSTILPPIDSASGLTRRPSASPWIGEGELGAVRGERLGDAPGDRVIVGDAHHQAALAFHQFGHVDFSFVLTRPSA